ncbi:MAG TPA: sugar nucleotide-binding protein [Glaciibacter sp.]|nr:sugar nucleotide-binding protein [Glaciibacter sp.]
MTALEKSVEMWAGLECTVNRTVHGYSDQSAFTGHDVRGLDDLAAFASLGVRRIRYPVLWENTAPMSPGDCDFTTSDARLGGLRQQGISPIVGLVHHGSGPAYTSLVDPEFPRQLAAYAAKVAGRYPWVDAYTPVNEPLTTARFSGLYGFWYPHGRDDRTFARALYNEIAGTILSMRAIRKVNPSARLVQTDDLGRAGGTWRMRYRVEFENDRRWLTMDLLMGRVTPAHPMYSYLTNQGGLSEGELRWLVDNACPPDIIGINHYPLSNRFLDHRIDLYPEWAQADDGINRYVDVGAVDTGQAESPSPEGLLREVWHRYRTPFAVTEAHIAGGREMQLRWLHEIWTTASRLQREGAPIIAVTAWALLGAFDWNTLCTTAGGDKRYESGVFDARWSPPRPTALAEMIRSLASGGSFEHPLLDRPGYWHQRGRALFAPSALSSPATVPRLRSRPLLVIGAGGELGRAFSQSCDLRGIDHVLLPREGLELTAEGTEDLLQGIQPWAVIDASQRNGRVQANPERLWRENARGTQYLAAACARHGIRFATFSSGSVFDGNATAPYRESHPVSPASAYGLAAAHAERGVTEVNPDALVIRPGTLFSPDGSNGLMGLTVRALRSGQTVRATHNVTVSPTYVPDLVGACLDLIADRVAGLLHVANKGAVTWADWARSAARLVGADSTQVVICPATASVSGSPVSRPRYRVLESERVDLLAPFEDAFERFSSEVRLREMT